MLKSKTEFDEMYPPLVGVNKIDCVGGDMIRILIVGFILSLGLTGYVYAVDCGQTLSQPQLNRLIVLLQQSNSNLLQHMNTLGAELQGAVGNPVIYEKLRGELDRVMWVHGLFVTCMTR